MVKVIDEARRRRSADEAKLAKARARAEVHEAAQKKSRLQTWWKKWKRSTAQALRRAKQKPKALPAKPTSTTKPRSASNALRFEVDPLLLVKGSDGLFRGAPDPTLVLAAWQIDDASRPRAVLRAAVRFHVTGALPGRAAPDVDVLHSAPLVKGHERLRLVVVAALFEENSGGDIRALASVLEHGEHVCLVDNRSGVPVVKHLGEVADEAGLDVIAARGILVDHRHASQTQSDQWVGAGVVVVGSRPTRHTISLQSADLRQDWTLSFSTRRV